MGVPDKKFKTENRTKSDSSSVGKIERVNASNDFKALNSDKWESVLKVFNPLGAIAEAYAKTLAYKIETKRLDVELTRINKQAEIAHNMIDKSFRLKIEELEHRRISLIGFYCTVNSELNKHHIARMKVLEMAQLAQKKAFEEGLSMEERILYKDMAIEMTRELPNFCDKSNESLQKLVQALPPVAISPLLLQG